jgi:acetyl-CoA acetyltransferase
MNGIGGVSIVGIGESAYYRHGKSPTSEFMLAFEAVQRAVADAGVDPREVDGYASFSADRNEPENLALAIGAREVNFANMVWGGGGGGCAAAIGNAAAAVVAGLARYVVVYRGLAQGQFGRFGQGNYPSPADNPFVDFLPHGMFAPVHSCALHTRRFMELYGVRQDALAAIALTSYRHAQRNPRAVMYGRPLTREMYDESRWIAEPFHLFDCCQENDGGAAVIVTTTERAADLRDDPVSILAAAQGTEVGHMRRDRFCPDFASSNFRTVAPQLFARAGLTPADIDVVQAYENFTGGVMIALVEHGFCAAEEVNDFMTEETFRFDGGSLPLNTSGGNLAEAYIHGLELVIEAVRQLRGESTSQVDRARTCLVIGGPFDNPVSDLLLASPEAS